ncbi:hypothetical protein L3Q82_015094 [Scortum barcoo]|uniref:Uncharacterized protein n=1 Tax=Scortum barcoo TaxID=214431 RepID=A0ACB8VSK7_9TELE|nr:hypothetical protein L3Q82_015094 [Scortum barcoo]
MDFCASHSLSITNTMFEHKGVHQCTWHQDTLGRRLMIDFVVGRMIDSGLGHSVQSCGRKVSGACVIVAATNTKPVVVDTGSKGCLSG